MKMLFITLLLIVLPLQAEVKSYKLGEGIFVKIEEMPFVPGDWNITYYENKEYVRLIDGKYPYGVDGNVPKTYLRKITAVVNNKEYVLDSSNMFDAWGSRPLEYPGSIKYFAGVCGDEFWCTFRGVFSDGAGAFVAEWRIRQGVSERSIITTSSDVVDLFIKNIGPPMYD